MAGIGEIVEEPRTVHDDSGGESGRDSPHRNNTKRKRSKKRCNSGGSQNPTQTSPSGNWERREEDENRGQSDPQCVDTQKQDVLPIREEHRAKFYESYRKVAEEYDKEFIKKYDEDSNTTLIFAGLFSAVTSAFIIQVDSQLQPDPGDETAALLRFLIYQMNNTALGGNVPTPPQWTGPPPTMVHVQAILYSSLAASLLSAFLAMLGKQWLNRYASTEMRGSAIDRGQGRQRKLDGVNKWYFDFVMESLPFMLQVALLLLGCALSRYLWETSIIIASVVIGVTSFGFLFYLFILIAGTVWDTCPYQTPGSRFFRYIGPRITRVVHLAASTIKRSHAVDFVAIGIMWSLPYQSTADALRILAVIVVGIPLGLVLDVCLLCESLASFFHHLAPTMLKHFRGTPPNPERQQTVLDLRCVSWTLQTSLEEDVRCSTLKHLTTVAAVAKLDPALITACFDIFVGCLSLSNDKAVVMQGLEQLATFSAECFLQILRQLSATRPTPSVLQDLSVRYNRAFPSETDLRGLPFHQAAANIHVLASQRHTSYFKWEHNWLPDRDLIPFARCMVEAAQAEYNQTQNQKMPRWILRFALHFLSHNPPSPTSVIADCLTIVAIALDHDLPSVSIPDESARAERVSSLIIQTLETMAGAPDADPIFQSKRKAINALFPYAVHLAQGGQQRMVDAILRVASKSTFMGFMWHHIGPYIARFFDESNPPSWSEAITLVSPFAQWDHESYTQNAVTRWVAAVAATPYSEEVGQSVVVALLQMAGVDSLRPHIPIDLWAWLKTQPSLPPVCRGRSVATTQGAVRDIRGLRDIEILKSYFLLVWSEWNWINGRGLTEMEIAIREEFRGTAMRNHREDLIERLRHILGQLDRGLEYLKQYQSDIEAWQIGVKKKDYRRLRKVLLEVSRGATAALPEP